MLINTPVTLIATFITAYFTIVVVFRAQEAANQKERDEIANKYLTKRLEVYPKIAEVIYSINLGAPKKRFMEIYIIMLKERPFLSQPVVDMIENINAVIRLDEDVTRQLEELNELIKFELDLFRHKDFSKVHSVEHSDQ
jgi:hypothetical protein